MAMMLGLLLSSFLISAASLAEFVTVIVAITTLEEGESSPVIFLGFPIAALCIGLMVFPAAYAGWWKDEEEEPGDVSVGCLSVVVLIIHLARLGILFGQFKGSCFGEFVCSFLFALYLVIIVASMYNMAMVYGAHRERRIATIDLVA